MPLSPPSQGLYRPEFEKDSCGFGLIAQMDNRPSHWLVRTSINALARLTHRGAVAADGKSGDGCGLLMRKPDAFLRLAAAGAGIRLGAHYGVGMVFLNRDPALAEAARTALREEKPAASSRARPCPRSSRCLSTPRRIYCRRRWSASCS